MKYLEDFRPSRINLILLLKTFETITHYPITVAKFEFFPLTSLSLIIRDDFNSVELVSVSCGRRGCIFHEHDTARFNVIVNAKSSAEFSLYCSYKHILERKKSLAAVFMGASARPFF